MRAGRMRSFTSSTPANQHDAGGRVAGMWSEMPRPSLTTALARLADLRAERKRRARDRFKLVAGDHEDRAAWIRQVDAWRAEVDEEIRHTKALVARLIAKRDARRK